MRKPLFPSMAIIAALTLLAALPLSTQASHSWGGYHWARSSNPVAIPVIDSMTNDWDGNLGKAVADWDTPLSTYTDVLDLTKVDGSTSNKTRKRCPASDGKVRACNANYGFNGWLGLAQIWVSGDHIVKGTAKMNDSYLFVGSPYEHGRQQVICQEVGHSWGLSHQDESGKDLGTCMDYSTALANGSPNDHDFEQLELIYTSHTDQVSAPPKKGKGKNRNKRAFENANLKAQAQWGRLVHGSTKGKSALYVRSFGGGLRIYTHVTWAP